MYSRNRSKGTRRYWNNGYKRNAYTGRSYQTSNRARASIRIPVTETFNMAWDKPVLTINNSTGVPAPSTSWAASNTTMVGCINPYMGLPFDDLVNRYGNAAHPNLNATQVRLPCGRAPAVNQKLYQIYTNMYDEVKLDGMTVSLAVLTPVGTTDLPSVSIATSWDRKTGINELIALREWQLNRPDIGIDNAALYPIPAAGSTANYNMVISKDYPNTYSELIGGSSATEATAINNSVAKIFRSCKASDLMERNIFHDCTLNAWQGHANTFYDVAFDTNVVGQIGFCPTFYFACKRPDTPTAADTTITIQAEVNYYFTFRNPKFGGTSFDPIASAAILNRAIVDGANAITEAQRAARIRSRDMSDRGEEVLSPETESGAAAAAAAAMEDDGADQELVVHDETTQYQAPTKKTESMDSKKGTM